MVPVLDKDNIPLMPCTEKRARLLLDRRQAFALWKRGVFCIKLLREPSARNYQDVVVGVDPGSKREAYTVATAKRLVLNVLTNTPWWVKGAVKQRREMRRGRRFRKTPCRKPRYNRSRGGLTPSTKSRWQAKLRILSWLSTLYPITDIIVEDIKATTKKGSKKWNRSFSPLEVGKAWFYSMIRARWGLYTIQGYDTKDWRDGAGYKKSTSKLSECWEAHNVDSHVMAEIFHGDHIVPYKRYLRVEFLQLHRRQLHAMQFVKGGIRRLYGGTRSMGFKRGSWVQHGKYGLCYVGGTSRDRISLHDMGTGKRLTQYAKPEDCRCLAYSTWRLPRV
jgi:hypothetical protein